MGSPPVSEEDATQHDRLAVSPRVVCYERIVTLDPPAVEVRPYRPLDDK
jgi:hypothetical protein